MSWLQVFDGLACFLGVGYLTPGTLADIAAHVDDEDLVGKVYLPQVHIVEHLLHSWLPDIVVARMPEQAYADDDAAFQRQAFLSFQELFLETGASAERYDLIILYHILSG